jgi:3-deoxy-manno-octulosonate cytidylyltransferase (CMP-KDO synthetase)
VEQLFNPNLVKVVVNKNSEAIYFSRSPIPYLRNVAQSEWVTHHTYFKHIGMYAYRSNVLERITRLEVSSLEKAESLEQLRWLENGLIINVNETTIETLGIDTPEDLKNALSHINHQP